jgi:cyclophilin family peptidyl-prolyl cis-trans isomerase/HEAT repeat protein
MTSPLSLRAIAIVTAVGVSACAPVPPPPPPPVAPPSYEQKLGWLLRLEDQRILRDPAPPAPFLPAVPTTGAPIPPVRPVPDLLAMLSDADARIRRRAALSVGRVGLAEGVAPLMALLADPDPDVRQMVCFALGLLGDRTATASLVAALGDADPRVQGRAADALGLIGAPEAAGPLGELVARYAADPAVATMAVDDPARQAPPAADAFRLATFALARLRAWEPMAAALLDAQGLPRVRWWPVAYALQAVEDRRAAQALLAFARGPGVEAVAFAVRGLGALREPGAVDVLIPLLDPAARDRRIAIAAAQALGRIGDPRAVRPLLALARDAGTDADLRSQAVASLGLLRARDALDDLLDLVTYPDAPLRSAALGAVASIDADTFITAVSGLDPDTAWQARVELAGALAALESERAAPRLGELVKDNDQRVVAAALRALAAVKAPMIADLLRHHLAADDLALRATAASLVGDLRPAGADAWLLDAWQRGQSDASYIARAAALSALARFMGATARQALENAAATDRDWAVRIRARQLLDGMGPPAAGPEIRPAPTRLAPGDYEAVDLVTPPFSPQVYLDTEQGTVQIELSVLDAPLTARNFVELARRGFYNGLPLHRVVPGFVVQGGDPRGDGEGGPGYTIRDELNPRPYLRGTVGMARAWADTGGSQFFIALGPQPHLEGRYTVFGEVVAGMEVVDRLRAWDVVQRVRVWDGVVPPAP